MNPLYKCSRYFCGFALLSFFSLPAIAQQTWDSTYRPEIYPLQVALFRSFEHSSKDIVFLGNSITFWANWNELLHSEHVKNRGIPGDMTFGVLDRLDEVVAGMPAKVFVLIGINDIARNIPDSVVVRNYRRIIQAIKSGSPKTKIFFQSILPTNSASGKLPAYYNREEHIKKINVGLKKLTEDESIGFIDLYSAFVDDEGHLPLKLTFDGVHLTKEGYDIWVKLLKDGHYIK